MQCLGALKVKLHCLSDFGETPGRPTGLSCRLYSPLLRCQPPLTQKLCNQELKLISASTQLVSTIQTIYRRTDPAKALNTTYQRHHHDAHDLPIVSCRMEHNSWHSKRSTTSCLPRFPASSVEFEVPHVVQTPLSAPSLPDCT